MECRMQAMVSQKGTFRKQGKGKEGGDHDQMILEQRVVEAVFEGNKCEER